MVKYDYTSNFASQIEGMIEQKHSLGYPYEESSRILKTFDIFCQTKFPNENMLTKELCLSWAIKKDSECANTFRNRLMPIRELSRHLNRLGVESYVIPANLAKKSPRYIPHIYSLKELRIFFDILDTIPVKKNFPVRHLVIPTYFRLIYCCGLRPAEARKLRLENVDLINGNITIIESKGHKDRIVPLSNDILNLCRRYHSAVCAIMPERVAFFPESNGNIYTKKWAEKTFRVQWAKTNIIQTSGNIPRIYDFRHTFATHRLYQWMKEGKDLTAFLPYLSSYLGHAQLSDTAYYIHLVPGIFNEMTEFDISKREDLLPEVTL